MKVPCENCTKRTIGCHSYCTAYKKYKLKYKSRDKEECEYQRYVQGAIDRMKGRGKR